MLAIAIHNEHVRKTGRRRGAQAIEHGRSFACIAGPSDDAKLGILAAQFSHGFCRPIGAPIYNDPDRPPKETRFGDRQKKLCAAVVAGDQYQMA